MLRVEISRRHSGEIIFDPNPATENISQDGGTFMFMNADHEAHQPQPDDPAFGVWFPDAIKPGTAAHPTPSILNTVTDAVPIAYTCNLHPSEKGSITFTK